MSLAFIVFLSTGIIGRSTSGPHALKRPQGSQRSRVGTRNRRFVIRCRRGAVVRSAAHAHLAKRKNRTHPLVQSVCLPPSWSEETRHKEAEGSSYYRHYYLGLLRHDGVPKLSAAAFPRDGSTGLCQWFHLEDPRLYDAVRWMKNHGVRYLRTGFS